MPHYILNLDTEGNGKSVALYSTIVDNVLTKPMTFKAMRKELERRGGYESWFQPYDADKVVAQERKLMGELSKGMEKLLRDQAQFLYFDEASGLRYVKLSDAYFTLEKRDWRNE